MRMVSAGLYSGTIGQSGGERREGLLEYSIPHSAYTHSPALPSDGACLNWSFIPHWGGWGGPVPVVLGKGVYEQEGV